MKPITIIGGGIAGLSLGIALRHEHIPVTIREAGTYPRHRVCGEFISGKGQEIIARLGLAGKISQAGALPARTGAIFIGAKASPVRSFATPALCISRYKLDALLASEFQALGGNLLAGMGRTPFSETEEGVVLASGRAPQTHDPRQKWYGIKAHAQGATLTADLELHTVPHGYVGLCRLADQLVNVCGLFHAIHGGGAGGSPLDHLKGPPGSPLHDRLFRSCFLPESLCTIAGLSYKAKPSQTCAIGDAFWTTPPATGNGMSMAFESAWIARSPLLAYSAGDTTWQAAQTSMRHACETAFSRRLFWGRLLHSAMMSLGSAPFAAPVLGSRFLWNLMFRKTRAADL
jgi:flavin-dependent dehydrogenase